MIQPALPFQASRCALFFIVLVLGTGASLAQTPEQAPVATTPHFAFYSDFETNLNDALIAAGNARKHAKGELFHAGPEVACFDALAPSARAAWDRVVDYYAEIVSPGRFTDRPQYLLRAYLAGFPDRPTDASSRQFVDIAAIFREAAAPAFSACRWSALDGKNRHWIGALVPRLAAYEQTIASRLEALYQKRWTGLPIRVDVVETVDWSGANTIILEPGGGHILVSNENDLPHALEVVFHEASHLLMDRRDPVQEALEGAAKSLGVELPADLWHVVLFYMTGETVSEILDAAGEPGYTPMLDEIAARNRRWDGYRKLIAGVWPAYMQGTQPLTDAAADLVRALPQPEPSPK
jgi:hypothetical protein